LSKSGNPKQKSALKKERKKKCEDVISANFQCGQELSNRCGELLKLMNGKAE